MKFIDITGRRFGRLVALRRVPSTCSTSKWLCRCDCDKECEKFLNMLIHTNDEYCHSTETSLQCAECQRSRSPYADGKEVGGFRIVRREAPRRFLCECLNCGHREVKACPTIVQANWFSRVCHCEVCRPERIRIDKTLISDEQAKRLTTASLPDRNRIIAELHDAGVSPNEIGRTAGISRQRVFQIIDRQKRKGVST